MGVRGKGVSLSLYPDILDRPHSSPPASQMLRLQVRAVIYDATCILNLRAKKEGVEGGRERDGS